MDMQRRVIKPDAGPGEADTIVVDDACFINQGTTRAVYLHPWDNRFIVKLPIDKKTGVGRANMHEFKSYREIFTKHGTLDCINACHGFVDTNRGQGLLCDCVRDDDGSISSTIWEMVIYQEQCDMKAILESADRLSAFLIEEDIRLFDMNLKNIAMRRRQSGVSVPVVIDLKGRFDNNEPIPVSSYFKYFARKKLKRRRRQLLERIVYFRENRHDFLSE